MEQNIRFTVIGRRAGLPDTVLREIDENIRLSRDNTGMTLCLAINYGGRTEIVDAVQAIAEQVRRGKLDPDAIDEDTVSDSPVHGGHARSRPARSARPARCASAISCSGRSPTPSCG